MTLELALVLVTAHFVGDFICQSDWMALNKSKDWFALFAHAGAYMVIGLAPVALWTITRAPDAYFADAAFGPSTPSMWMVGNMAAHFAQDAITSRINARLWFIDGVRIKPDLRDGTYAGSGLGRFEVAYNDKRHWFFVGIGADQLLHYVTLFVTASWWLQ